jgi:serine/threonine-protein phosphatase PP1 catalytic subunit
MDTYNNHRWLENNPDFVRSVGKRQLIECLSNVEVLLSREPALLELEGRLVFVGDTHGDFVVTKEIAHLFFQDKAVKLVFLGDYIDRAPEDVETSVPNICYLLFLKYCYPENIFLLQGNHEATYAIPCHPYQFKDEVERLYPGLHERFLAVFAQMPLMVLANNVFAAHGGIPKKYRLNQLRSIPKNDPYLIEAVTWSDPATSMNYRGAGYPYSSKDLEVFLKEVKAELFLKSHDYNTLGNTIFNRRCLTIFSSRRYKEMGNNGILIARVNGPIKDPDELMVEELRGKTWREYAVRHL